MKTSLLVYRFGSMTESAQSPLIRSFERHLRAQNRSPRTIAGYLVALRQADAFLRAHGITIHAATRADLEAFLADLLTRRAASTAATYHKVLKLLYRWLDEEDEIDRDPTAKMKRPIVPEQPVPVVPEDGLRRHATGRPVTEPIGCVTAKGNHHYLALPPGWLVANYGNGTQPSRNGWVRGSRSPPAPSPPATTTPCSSRTTGPASPAHPPRRWAR
jgi:hypothetical protein